MRYHHILRFIWLLAMYVQKSLDFTQRACNPSILNVISDGISCSGEADEYLSEDHQRNVQGADGLHWARPVMMLLPDQVASSKHPQQYHPSKFLLINSWFILPPLPGRAPSIQFALSHKQQLPHLTLRACLPLKYTDSHDNTAVMPAIPPWIWSHSPESARRPLIPCVYSPCRVPCCTEGNFREVMEHASFPGGVQEVYTRFRGLAFWFSALEAAKEHLPWLWLAGYSHLDVMLWALPLWTLTPRSFGLKPALSSLPACCQIPGSRCRRLVGSWFFNKQKHPKNFLTHIMVICCTIHWVVKNVHCHHGNCNFITYCQGVLFSFLALL